MKMNSQGGFTLIELIVVIVILGILAATALPRFTNLSGDARLASLNAARGALVATSAMTHGRFMINPVTPQNVEGAVVTMVNGYPGVDPIAAAAENVGLMQAAGLAADYTITAATATTITVVPTNIVGTPTAATCFLTYTEATGTAAAPVPPTVVVTGTANTCN
ncbi:type II secretion system protein [Massilia niabensis]|uniref:Type II secretion system protein n=1 Tax=Massilia niabensis TaxID=544910 RepID=A0ABW0L6K8_9BURK